MMPTQFFRAKEDEYLRFNELHRLSTRYRKKPNLINMYFVPGRVFGFRLVNLANGGISCDEIGSLKDISELFYKVYRKLKCIKCSEVKWADEFDWNRRGLEGPYPQFWGKRDSLVA
jgi:hypothetical protein